MSWKPEEDERVSAAVPLIGRPIQTDGGPPQEMPFKLSLRAIWGFIKGNTAYDVSRMREAGVQHVIGKGKKPAAEAELIVQEAAKTDAERQVKLAEAYAIKKKADDDSMLARVNTLDKFVDTVSKLKQYGGDLGFDLEELQRTVFQTGQPARAAKKTAPMAQTGAQVSAKANVAAGVNLSITGSYEKVPGEPVSEDDQDREDERIQESYYDQPNYQADDEEEESESIDADGESESSEEDESSLEEEPAP